MQSIGEGCYRVLPVFIEDEDVYWDQVLETLDRWGDRRVPKTEPSWFDEHRGFATL